MLVPEKLYEIKLQNGKKALSNFVIFGKNSSDFECLVEDLKDAFELLKIAYSRKETDKTVKFGDLEYSVKGKLKALGIIKTEGQLKGIFGFGNEQVEVIYNYKNNETLIVDRNKDVCSTPAIIEILLTN